MSCASCHDPRFAYGPPDGKQSGPRAVPSLRYLQVTPQFTEHYFDAETTGDDSVDNGPTGGLTWDGRVDRGRDQARLPLLSPGEMANTSPAAVVARAMKADDAGELRRLSRGDAFATILEALEAWEQDPKEFYPYSSRYDAWLKGGGGLTERELRGLKLFTDPAKGNCAQCHPATRGASGTPPQFTDYGLIALGVPRNQEIPANADPAWFDLGLCGPERTDFRDRPEYCGRFRAPSLRNVALRKSFFHNGVFRTLREAVQFYVKRDPAAADLPEKYRSNLETGPPFPAKAGDKPALTDEEIDDIVAFLETLTDR
jgi:cytochrome c peroxidase